MSRPRSVVMCPYCGASEVTRESQFAWRQHHLKSCGDYAEYEYRRTEAQRDAMDTERESFDRALESGRYDPDTAA